MDRRRGTREWQLKDFASHPVYLYLWYTAGGVMITRMQLVNCIEVSEHGSEADALIANMLLVVFTALSIT